MGQEITAIITNQQLHVGEEIIHFKEGECTIIPLDIHPWHLEHFITEALKFLHIEELLDDLTMKSSSGWNIEGYCDPTDENEYRNSLKTLIDRIRSMKLQHFILHHYSDFASMPTDGCFIFIRNGEIVKESAMFRMDGLDPDDYISFLQEIGLPPPPYWFANETKFHHYSNAEEVYLTQNRN